MIKVISVTDAAQSLGIRENLLYDWKQPFEDKQTGNVLSGDERSELMKLSKENKQLRMEKETLKKASAFFAREHTNQITRV